MPELLIQSYIIELDRALMILLHCNDASPLIIVYEELFLRLIYILSYLRAASSYFIRFSSSAFGSISIIAFHIYGIWVMIIYYPV